MQEQGARGRRIIDTLNAARSLFAPALQSARNERLHVAHLDADDALIGLRLQYSKGSPTVALPLRAIIGDALRLKSVTLLLAHNHPSGDPTPTPADILATRHLVQAARPLGICVRDHLVFGGGDVRSFRMLGLL